MRVITLPRPFLICGTIGQSAAVRYSHSCEYRSEVGYVRYALWPTLASQLSLSAVGHLGHSYSATWSSSRCRISRSVESVSPNDSIPRSTEFQFARYLFVALVERVEIREAATRQRSVTGARASLIAGEPEVVIACRRGRLGRVACRRSRPRVVPASPPTVMSDVERCK